MTAMFRMRERNSKSMLTMVPARTMDAPTAIFQGIVYDVAHWDVECMWGINIYLKVCRICGNLFKGFVKFANVAFKFV